MRRTTFAAPVSTAHSSSGFAPQTNPPCSRNGTPPSRLHGLRDLLGLRIDPEQRGVVARDPQRSPPATALVWMSKLSCGPRRFRPPRHGPRRSPPGTRRVESPRGIVEEREVEQSPASNEVGNRIAVPVDGGGRPAPGRNRRIGRANVVSDRRAMWPPRPGVDRVDLLVRLRVDSRENLARVQDRPDRVRRRGQPVGLGPGERDHRLSGRTCRGCGRGRGGRPGGRAGRARRHRCRRRPGGRRRSRAPSVRWAPGRSSRHTRPGQPPALMAITVRPQTGGVDSLYASDRRHGWPDGCSGRHPGGNFTPGSS